MEMEKLNPYLDQSWSGMHIVPGMTALAEDGARERRKLILGAALGKKNLAVALVEFADKYLMFDSSLDLHFIWTSFRDYVKHYQALPTVQVLLTNLIETRGLDWQSSFGEHDLRELVSELYLIAADPPEDAYLADMLQEFRTDHIVETAPAKIRQAADAKALAELFTTTSRELAHSPLERPDILKPFDNMEHNLTMVAKKKFHIPWLDILSDDGLAPGEMMSMILPSGCGKSTIGLEIAEAGIMNDTKTAYMSTEQGLAGDMALRQSVLASGGTRTEWKKYSSALEACKANPTLPVPQLAAYLSPGSLQRFLVTRELWQANFRFIQCNDPRKAVYSVEALIEDTLNTLAEEGFVPEILVLDWWGRLCDKLVAHEKDPDSARKRITRNSMGYLKHLAEQRQLRVIVFHQVAGGAAIASLKGRARSNTAQGDKDFNNMFDAAYVSTMKDGEGNIRLFADKARSAANSDVILHVDGERCHMVPANPDHGGHILKPNRPSAAPPKRTWSL